MRTHDGLDGLGGLVGVVEGDGGDVVVQDMGFHNAVQQLAADEAEFAVDGCGGAAGVGPGGGGVVGEAGVGVLEEGDGDCGKEVGVSGVDVGERGVWKRGCLPSQWFTHRYGMMYQTVRFARPYFSPMNVSRLMVMARPRSLSRISLESLASYSGLAGSKWLTPPPKPFFLPLPRPSGWRSCSLWPVTLRLMYKSQPASCWPMR